MLTLETIILAMGETESVAPSPQKELATTSPALEQKIVSTPAASVNYVDPLDRYQALIVRVCFSITTFLLLNI